MTQEEFDNHPAWKDATFEGAVMSVLRLGIQSTFAEKLRWLEEAETFSLSFPSTAGAPSPRVAFHRKIKKAKIEKRKAKDGFGGACTR